VREKSLTLASVVAAAGASLCCIGPQVAAALGLGAFGAASLFENLRPYLLAVTALLLGSAIFLRIRSQQKPDCVNGVCTRAPAHRSMRTAMLLVSIAAVVAIAAVPQLSNAFLDSLIGPTVLASQGIKGQSVTTLKIEGMTCAACASGLKATLARENGVLAVEVSYEKAMARISFDSAKTSFEELVAVIGDLGYVAKRKEGE
jgi:copper chaperone CopZ